MIIELLFYILRGFILSKQFKGNLIQLIGHAGSWMQKNVLHHSIRDEWKVLNPHNVEIWSFAGLYIIVREHLTHQRWSLVTLRVTTQALQRMKIRKFGRKGEAPLGQKNRKRFRPKNEIMKKYDGAKCPNICILTRRPIVV